MKAWCISNKTLTLETRTRPQPGPNEVQVQVHAIGVNRADLAQTMGVYPAPPGVVADIPGLEYSGVVSAVGHQVMERKVGDAVMGLVPGGAYAEYICTHEHETLNIPTGYSMAEAATVPEAFLTAYRALFLQAGLQHGETCLVRPATSGIGLAAIQLCQAFGNPVIGSSRNPDNLATATTLGLSTTVTEGPNMAAEVLAHTQQKGVAAILDMVGPEWEQLLPALAVEGHLVIIGLLGGLTTSINLAALLQKRHHLSALTMRHQPLQERLRIAAIFNQRLQPYFTEQRLTALPHKTFPFSEALTAHEHMKTSAYSGKRVLQIIG